MQIKLVSLAAGLLMIGALGGPRASAQSLDDLKLQLHGYATQGFIYSTKNNWDTTNSSDGSAAYTEAVVSLSAQPVPKLRVGAQVRYFLLGDYNDSGITLDWAQGDYKVNERFGFRMGKVKTPMGLFNESQDIDPAQLWILLPQSIYPLASRNALLSHFGGVIYGTIPLGEKMGKLAYRGFGGERVIPNGDGYLRALLDSGLNAPSGLKGRMYGSDLVWRLPISGLQVGAVVDFEKPQGAIVGGPYTGQLLSRPIAAYQYFGQYEHNRYMVAGEYRRIPASLSLQLSGLPARPGATDPRQFYFMASYRVTSRLSTGMYYSSCNDHAAKVSAAKFQKDWTLSGRYDLNAFLYAKIEQHFMDGTNLGYSVSDNTGGLQPNTRMTLLKLGVSF